MNYQRKRLSDMSDIREPGPLPQELWGSLSDADLAHIGDLVPPERASEYAGQGFFPVSPPPPPPVRVISQLEFIKRIPTPKRIAIMQAAAGPDFALQAMLQLINAATHGVDLDDTDTVNGLAYAQSIGILTTDDVAAIRA